MAVTIKQQSTRSQRIKERAKRRRDDLWPNLGDMQTWDRGRSDGFSTIPRTLTLIGTIADSLAEKNKRVSSSYIGLWCRVWDTGMVVVDNEYELATEAGFSGERRVYTWRDRIKQLKQLGFVDVKPGPKGSYQFILIFNPYHVLEDINGKGQIQEQYWMAIIERTEEIGANDLIKYRELKDAEKKPKK